MMDELISRLTPILPHPQQQSSSSNIITKGKLLMVAFRYWSSRRETEKFQKLKSLSCKLEFELLEGSLLMGGCNNNRLLLDDFFSTNSSVNMDQDDDFSLFGGIHTNNNSTSSHTLHQNNEVCLNTICFHGNNKKYFSYYVDE
jgi:hypothetical protein